MYIVLYTITIDDGLRFEPGENDLSGATIEQVMQWIANGWVLAPRGVPTLPTPDTDPPPVALPHWEGEGDPPPGTWEYEWRQRRPDASGERAAETPRRKRRETQE